MRTWRRVCVAVCSVAVSTMGCMSTTDGTQSIVDSTEDTEERDLSLTDGVIQEKALETTRINVGGSSAYVDPAGRTWQADPFAKGGQSGNIVDRGNITIPNTKKPGIYQTERYCMTELNMPVTNGTYTVKLFFAETYMKQAGQRVFDVDVEGSVLRGLDVIKETGAINRALLKTFKKVVVRDKALTLRFQASANCAELNGIELLLTSRDQPEEPPIEPQPPSEPETPNTPAGEGDISRYLVGNNVWWNPDDRIWQLAGQAGLKIVRIGGIEYDRNVPSNEKLTDWVNRIKGIGAEPMIQVSQYRSPEEAANLVRYFNLQSNNKVKFWNIGNEPWLERGRPGDMAGLARTVAGYVKSIASAMKTVDPSIKIYAPDECDYFDVMYNALLGGESDIAGKDQNGRYYIDGISWHRYVGGDLANAGAEEFRVRMEKTKTRIEHANKLHGRTGANALSWGIGEFNASEGGAVHSFANGQMFGQIFGHAMRYGAAYVATWSMFENGGSRGGTDFSFVDGPTGTPRSSYYHMQAIARHFSGKYANGQSSIGGVRVFGAKDAGKTAVMVLNIEGSGQRACTLRLSSAPITSGECRLNVDAGIALSSAVTINSQETLVLVFDAQGKLTKRITYSSREHWQNNRPPTEGL